MIKSIVKFIAGKLIRILGMFIKTDSRMILFVSFAGKKYDDSPKAIYKKMLNDERFKNYKFVWVFKNPENFNVPGAVKIKKWTPKYIYYTLKARCVVTDMGVNIENYKREEKFYVNTWHGTPIKKLEGYVAAKPAADIMCVQGKYEVDIFARAFEISPDKIIISGLPRNDILANYDSGLRDEIRSKLSLPKNKKIIFYCPTFRNYEKLQNRIDFAHSLKIPVNLKEWEKKLGKDYIILFRAHHAVVKTLDIQFDDFVYDFSNYEYLNDLMIASDILISDYSGILFDYSIMGKPMLCFAYDYEKYMENRGMYIDIRKELPCEVAYDEDTLLEQIIHLDYEKMSGKTLKFREKYVEEFGNASQFCVDKIWESIQ